MTIKLHAPLSDRDNIRAQVRMQVSHAITNIDGTFAEADEAYYQMLQLTRAELCKRDILSVTFPADHASNRTLLHQLIDYGTPFWIQKRYVRDDNSLVWVLNHVTRTVGITGVARIAATSFILPLSFEIDGAGWESLAEQTRSLIN